jgi:hypothetical protein
MCLALHILHTSTVECTANRKVLLPCRKGLDMQQCMQLVGDLNLQGT